jgi:hypothetical protein
MAGELGLEPRMTVPKTGVLPLHHSPTAPKTMWSICGQFTQRGAEIAHGLSSGKEEMSVLADFLDKPLKPAIANLTIKGRATYT